MTRCPDDPMSRSLGFLGVPNSAMDSCEIIFPYSKVTQTRRVRAERLLAMVEARSKSGKQPSMFHLFKLLWTQISYCSWRIMGKVPCLAFCQRQGPTEKLRRARH